MQILRAAGRAFALTWHLALGILKLGLRVTVNSFSRGKDSRANIFGRTLAEILAALGPTYVKLGQILSTRRDLLSEPVLQQLGALRDRLPPIPFGLVPSLFREEFGVEIEVVFSEFDPTPIASASVASVYRAQLQDGRLVAVKVRRPGIAVHIKADLCLLRSTAFLLEHIPPLRVIPLRRTIDEFGECLVRQLDFRLEATANRRLRAALVYETNIVIPALVEELCSSSILTMEYLDDLGGAVQLDADQARRSLLAALHALYRMIFVEGFIHCDMHQGNLHFLSKGRSALVDFGFMAELDRSTRLKFAEFFYAMATNDGVRCAQITLETALFAPPELAYEAFEEDVVFLVDQVAGAAASKYQVADFVVRLFDVQRRYRIVGTTGFTMAIVSLLVFEGIAKEIYPDLDFQREARPFILRASLRAYRRPSGQLDLDSIVRKSEIFERAVTEAEHGS